MKTTTNLGWFREYQKAAKEREALRAENLRLAEQIQRDNDACKKLSGYTFEELAAKHERLCARIAKMQEQQRADTAELAKLDAAKADTERLDWLEREDGGLVGVTIPGAKMGMTLRAAIDQARKAQP